MAGGTLTVDLGAVAANYGTLQKAAPKAEVAAVVKANAYGTGMGPVARRLAAAGCRTFFVADAREGATLRKALAKALPEATIYVLNGLFPARRRIMRRRGSALSSPRGRNSPNGQRQTRPCPPLSTSTPA